MSLVLAAVGTAVTALIQTSILPFTAGGGGLDLVLVFAVVWTMTVNLEGGLVWAFLGGLIIDVLLMRPLGLTAFVLLLAVGAAWVVGRLAARAIYPAAVAVAGVAAGLASAVTTFLYGMLAGSPSPAPLAGVLPAIVLGAVAALIVAPVPILVRRRLRGDDTERLDW